MSTEKILELVIAGSFDANISFTDLCRVIEALGFVQRQHGGSHRIYTRIDVPEIINVQPGRDGHNAKPYQVKQVRNIILKYRLILSQ